LLKKFSIISV